MHTEIKYTTDGLSIGGAGSTRFVQIVVGNTIYFLHGLDYWRSGSQETIILGYQRDGVDMLFTHIPYEDDTFVWAAGQFGDEPTAQLFVLVDGERQAVEIGRLRKIETATMVGPVWCPVANMIRERPYGPGGREMRRGSKHFAPGAKLYCYPALWGDGYEQIQVLGRHRASHRYVKMIVSEKWLVNWRAELVYSPHLIRELWPAWDGTAESHERAQRIADMMNLRVQERAGATQEEQGNGSS